MGWAEARGPGKGFVCWILDFFKIYFYSNGKLLKGFEEGSDMIDYQLGNWRLPEPSSCPVSKLRLDMEWFCVQFVYPNLSHFPTTGVTHL